MNRDTGTGKTPVHEARVRSYQQSPGAVHAQAAEEAPRRSGLQRFVIVAILLLFAGSAMVIAFGAGMVFERSVVADQPESSDAAPDKIDRAWAVVEENYVQPEAINEGQMTEGAIEGMLSTLGDQGHTRYLTAEETRRERQQSSGSYVGVGILVEETEEGELIVVKPFEGSPALEAGVEPGDVIVAVEGEDVTEQPLREVIEKIRGPEGTTVEISFLRPSSGETLDFTLERQRIEVSPVTWTMLEDNAALIQLSQFTSGSAEDVANALQAAQDAGAERIIFDLRNNPGGFVNEAVDIASMFVPEGSTVFIRETREGGQTEVKATEQPVRVGEDMPVVVLINHGSASSSEIVAGAIKANTDHPVIGETTVGTGTVLNQFQLGDGSTIWLGVELWLTPSGEMIRDDGVRPDILVSLKEDQVLFTPDPTSEPTDVPETESLDDYQIEFAINLLQSTEGDAQSMITVPVTHPTMAATDGIHLLAG